MYFLILVVNMVEIVGKHRVDFAHYVRYIKFNNRERRLNRRHKSVGSPGLQVTKKKVKKQQQQYEVLYYGLFLVLRFRRFPCNITRPSMLNVFVNQSIDTEIRIAAYLQVMRCPVYSVVRHIVTVLDAEEVNQGKYT